MTQIHISFEHRKSDGDRGALGFAFANIARLGDGPSPFGEIVMSDLVVPMTRSGVSERLGIYVDLNRGRYVVSVSLPTGEQINELLEVGAQGFIELVLSPPVPIPKQVEQTLEVVPVSRSLEEVRMSPPAALVPTVNRAIDREFELAERVARSVPVSRPLKEVRQGPSTPPLPVSNRATDREFESAERVAELVPQKPQALFVIGRRKSQSIRSEASSTRRLALPSAMPGLVDMRPMRSRLLAPLIENYTFVDLKNWVSQLQSVADSGVVLTPEPLEQGLGQTRLSANRDAEMVPDFGGELTLNLPDGIAGQRYSCTLDAKGSVHQLAVLPNMWTNVEGQTQESIVDLHQEWDGLTATWNLKTSIRDVHMSSVLGFMANGDLPRARRLLSRSLQMLMGKVQNPYAAAAAGYVLIYSRDTDLEHGEWPEWLTNLATWFPSLPDGQILLATLCLQRRRLTERARLPIGQSDEDRLGLAHVLLERAMRAGLPMFSLGMRLLVENLEILRDETHRADIDSRQYEHLYSSMPLDRALEHVRAISRYMKSAQAMTVLDFAGLQSKD